MTEVVEEPHAPSIGLRPVPLPSARRKSGLPDLRSSQLRISATAEVRVEEEPPPGPRIGSAHGYGPEVVEAVRVLVVGTDLPQHVIAARVGLCRATVSNLRARGGWTRPGAARLRGQRGGDSPILAAANEAARPLIEETTLSETAIAKRLGLGRSSLRRWRVRFGWRRPAGAPTFLPAPRRDGRARPFRYRRVKGRPYAADAVETARELLTGTTLSQVAIAERLGVSHGWVGRLLRRHRWERPPAPKRVAMTVRTGPLATEGDRRGRPYATEVRREARNLWERTLLSTRMIGLRVGCKPHSVTRWARQEGWERPHGRSTSRKLRGYFGVVMRGG